MVAPVVLIAFNRPEQTARALDHIRRTAPDQLFLVVDGPRADRPDEAERCAAVRAVLESVDWPCAVERRYAERNLGMAANIETGLDWVFGQVDRAIVLEDDCLASGDFIGLCTELLDRYADDPRVGHIGGLAPDLPDELFGGHSYAFAAFSSIWGWATWARQWHLHRRLYPRTHADSDTASWRTQPTEWGATNLTTRAGRRYFERSAERADAVAPTWAVHWVESLLASRALAITASHPLVSNVGLGADGSNTLSERDLPDTRPLTFPLVHPPVELNVAVETLYEQFVAREFGLTARAARVLLPEGGRLRDLARRAQHRRQSATRT